MEKTMPRWLVGMLLIIFYPITFESAVEVQHMETDGTIGFIGVYEPSGKPDPPPDTTLRPPITESAKPDGSLPKTNEVRQFGALWIGIFFVSLVCVIWRKRHKDIYKN